MRTNDPNVLAQFLFEDMTTSKPRVPQHTGAYIAEVVDTNTNNSQVPAGTVKIVIPQLSGNAGYVPAPYPGVLDPPLGTKCVVVFEGNFSNAPRVLSFVGWQSPRVWVQSADPTTSNPTYAPTQGDMWVTP